MEKTKGFALVEVLEVWRVEEMNDVPHYCSKGSAWNRPPSAKFVVDPFYLGLSSYFTAPTRGGGSNEHWQTA